MSFAPFLSSLVQSPLVQSIIDHEHEREKEKEKEVEWLSWKTGLFAVFAANLAASLAVYGIVSRNMKDMGEAWEHHYTEKSDLMDALTGQTEQLEAQMSSIETELGNLKSLYQDQLDPNIYTNLNGKLDNIKKAYENVVQEFHQYQSNDHDFLNQRMDALQAQLQSLQSEFDNTYPMKRSWNNSNQDDVSSGSSYDPEYASSESSFDPENIHLPTDTSEQQ